MFDGKLWKSLNFKYANVNIARFLLLTFVASVTFYFNQKEVFFLNLALSVFSFIYLIIEVIFNLTENKPKFSYVVTGTDIAFILVLVYATGMNSFLLGGLIYVTAITTQNNRIQQGKFSLIFSTIVHALFITFLYLDFIPYVDIFKENPVPNSVNIIIAFLSTYVVNYLVYSIITVLRTELVNKNKDLELERNKLLKSYISLDEDLNIARKIQSKLIPSTSPFPFVHSLYHPMMHVGGDFFELIKFPNQNLVGIFLSDVSGHGVPAAFITSMIKTTLFQAGERKENPKELMAYLNEVLFEQTGGFFITALYAIYNQENQNLCYCNAGHEWPLVLREQTIEPLFGPRSSPIGIFSNAELSRRNKNFENSNAQLYPKDRIVFFTDGVTEVRKIGTEGPYLDEKGFFDFLNSASSKVGKEFISTIFSFLTTFRGSNQFEDDLLILSLEC